VILVAFVLGFFLGHFTGSDNVTTVTEQQVQAEEQKEAKEEEEAPALAEARIEKAKAENEGEAKAAEVAKQAKEEEAEAKNGEAEGGEEAAGGEGEAAAGGGAASAAGKEVFTSTCGACHTLSEAGTTGEVGPNLDELMPEKALVETQVTNGGGGMPAFGGQLSEEEIQDVATYVSEVAGS
jgi:mono/diheme cytochrome c family protein